jgi:hypothetical protein
MRFTGLYLPACLPARPPARPPARLSACLLVPVLRGPHDKGFGAARSRTYCYFVGP